MQKRILVLLTSVLFFLSCQHFQKSSSSNYSSPPELDREFRAAWIATVANINWPSSPGLSVALQKKEAVALLDLLKSMNFNAVIFQVRPQSDALYESSLEPWSYYLTGEQGTAPVPFYDPLEFWIEEAHKRGLELHAWLNPYRAHHPSGGPVTENSIVNTKSDLVVKLENGYWWLDPSMRETQEHSLNVVMDIVNRYDVDGIHFDDYFYPYPSYNNEKDFPDDKSWNDYKNRNGELSREDWRRNSVNTFIEELYRSIKEEKKHIKFGLSPFGIWRPGNPSSIQGFDQHDELYADAKKWLNEGWVDYFAPQLYWPINQIPQSFPVLLNWWNEQNYQDRAIWPGVSVGRFQGEQQIDEIINNIMITRGMNSKSPGLIHWSIAPLVNNDTLQNELKTKPYFKKAIVPSQDWVTHNIPDSPVLDYDTKSAKLSIDLKHSEPNNISNWVIQAKFDDIWSVNILPRTSSSIVIPFTRVLSYSNGNGLNLPNISTLQEVHITYIDRLGFQSKPFVMNFKK
jgi:uncharacterized lipoprotein YddW (UPF0748 family)